MNRLILSVFTFLFYGISAFSQHYSIQSNVFDEKNGEAIEVANVRLLNASDSSFVQAAQTDAKGYFTLSRIAPGDYILTVSFLGYNQHTQNVPVKNRNVILKNIQMSENAQLLKEVEVRGTAVQMTVKGDTLEYNATAYKTQENAAVEDLLKKLPGVEVDSDGKITVNGEEIKNIRVDGKKFFSGDTEQAVKNLPADMIDKIQVLEQKSDMALLTGFEDGDTERIINLTTKPNRRKGVFGNAGAGAGADMEVFDKGHEFSTPDDGRYEASVSVNIMNGDAQTTVNAGANNINQSRGRRGRGGWGGGSGVTNTQNIGINNNTIVNPKLKVGGDFTGNHSNNVNISDTYREEYAKGDTTIFNKSNNNSVNNSFDANVRFEAEWTIDTLNTIIFQPNFNYNSGASDSRRDYLYKTASDSVLWADADSTSWGDSHNWGDNFSVSGGLNVIYNRKSATKKGRSFTVNVNTGFSESNSNSWNISNKYTSGNLVDTLTLNQYTDNASNNFNARTRLSWVEPLWNAKNMLEAAASVSYSKTSSEKMQYGYDGAAYTNLNEEYSNSMENMFYRENIELNYRYQDKSYNIMFGLN
ncbi:MAG: carboxypeptidase-like regulatory domain-containing protein, partial [Prevotellaceae bacterium]|nr:carboxypeptidase-like regulatory domain-containing protein [Prevotellaceae bacterium]